MSKFKVQFAKVEDGFIASGDSGFGYVNAFGDTLDELNVNIQECIDSLCSDQLSESAYPTATLVEVALEDFE